MSLRYLLDSDICIYLMKRRPAALTRRLDTHALHCALSVVAYGELCFGQAGSTRAEESAAHLAALIETIQVLPLPLEAAMHYGDIRVHLEREGRLIGGNDLWIAAHALAANLILVTNNEREFARVPGLRLENWAR
jgi:tRNA(fMet)-specific endonuclease VapC